MAVKETSFMQLKRQIRNKDIKNLYLMYGEEEFIKDVYIKRLTGLIPEDAFSEFNQITIDGKKISFEDIDNVLESFPMMAEKKLVIIKDSGIFKSPNEDVKSFWTKRFSDIPDYLILIFDEKEVDKRSATYKSINKSGMAVEFKYLRSVELVNWVESTMLRAGKKIDKSNAEYIVSICDEGVGSIKNELDKLISYSDKEIYISDIDKVVSKSLQVRMFEMTDAIMNKDTKKVISILTELKTIKEPAFRVLYTLSSTFDKLLHSKLLLKDGMTYGEIASRLGTAPFIANKYIRSANGFKEDYLVNRTMKIAEIDYAIKQGEINDWAAIEDYVIECIYMQ